MQYAIGAVQSRHSDSNGDEVIYKSTCIRCFLSFPQFQPKTNQHTLLYNPRITAKTTAMTAKHSAHESKTAQDEHLEAPPPDASAHHGPDRGLLHLPSEVLDMIYQDLYQHAVRHWPRSQVVHALHHYRVRGCFDREPFVFRFDASLPRLDFLLVSKAALNSFRSYDPIWEGDLIFEDKWRGPLLRWRRNFCNPDQVRHLKINIQLLTNTSRKLHVTPSSLGDQVAQYVLQDAFRIINMIMHRGANITTPYKRSQPLSLCTLSLNLAFSTDRQAPTSRPVWNDRERCDIFRHIKTLLTNLSESRYFDAHLSVITFRCNQPFGEWSHDCARSHQAPLTGSQPVMQGFRWGLWAGESCQKINESQVKAIAELSSLGPRSGPTPSNEFAVSYTTIADANIEPINFRGQTLRRSMTTALHQYFSTGDPESATSQHHPSRVNVEQQISLTEDDHNVLQGIRMLNMKQTAAAEVGANGDRHRNISFPDANQRRAMGDALRQYCSIADANRPRQGPFGG